MDIYLALRDNDDPKSHVVGAFSTEELARVACQEHADDIADGWGDERAELFWRDTEAVSNNGSVYDVILLGLDEAS